MAAYWITEQELDTACDLLFDRLYDYWRSRGWPSEKADMGGEIMGPNAIKLFIGFDSKFFEPDFKESQCIFRHMPMLGREFNYFFQGLAFRSFEQTETVMRSFMVSWKAHYAIPIVGGEGAIHLVSDNDWYMARLGYTEHDGRWHRYLVRIVNQIAQYYQNPKVYERYHPLPPDFRDLLNQRMIRMKSGLPPHWLPQR